MEALDYWRLCDELTVIQAALLVVGQDPAPIQDSVEGWEAHQRPDGYEAAKVAIANGLLRKRIRGYVVPRYNYGEFDRQIEIPDSIDIRDSTVDVDSLKDWLRGRGIKTGFFFPLQLEGPDYLDKSHPRYAPKLAAAIRAWLVIDDAALNGKHPKQALTKWLREHAAEFQLADEEGKPNEKGIEETAKVANWKQSGGAPTTPNEDPF